MLENSFQSHDLVQQHKDNQSNSHKDKKEFSKFVNAIQRKKNKKLDDLQLPQKIFHATLNNNERTG